MSKTLSEIRFEKSRKRLSEVLRNLEEVVKEKIHETAIDSKMIDISDASNGSSRAQIIEQAAVIQNLNYEINKLQKNLSELGNEGEFLSEKNKLLGERIQELRTQSKILIDAIEADLLQVEEAINDN